MSEAKITETEPDFERGGIIDAILNTLFGSIKWTVEVDGGKHIYRGRVRRIDQIPDKIAAIAIRHHPGHRFMLQPTNQEEDTP